MNRKEFSQGMSNREKRHMQAVADWGSDNGCVCCGEPFAHVHHVLEGRTPGRRSSDMLTIPLCEPCHTGSKGIHGTRERWSLRNMDEMKALAATIKGVFYGR